MQLQIPPTSFASCLVLGRLCTILLIRGHSEKLLFAADPDVVCWQIIIKAKYKRFEVQ